MGSAASIGKAIRADLSKMLKDVMILACDNLRNSTPVDTTNAANNWILSTGSPYNGTDGSREAPSHAAQDAGIQAIQNYDIGRDGKIYIRNNVFYLPFLAEGGSPQADAGWVTTVLLAAARRASTTHRPAVRKMLGGMARTAFIGRVDDRVGPGRR